MALRDLITPKPYPISTPGAKTTAPAPVVVEDDVAPLKESLSAGRTQLEQLRTDQTRMGGEAANLTLQIAADTANLVSYQNAQEVFKAEQKVAESQGLEKNIKKMLDDERSSPQYKEKERINKELAELGSFVPTEVTAPMLGVLFSAIGATGMLLGGNSKSHAKFAMAAMNGMAEGFGKGREQYNKEQKAAFDTNVKLLQTKLSAIKDGLEDARREAILNKEAADIKVRQTLASNEAQFLQKHTDQRGLESTIALVDEQLKNLNRAIQFQTSKATQLAGQLDAKETQLAMRKIESARREAEARIRSQDQERRDKERREDRLSDITRSENFRREMAKYIVENRPPPREPREPRSAVERAREEREIRTLVQGVRGIENLQKQLRDPEVRTGLVAKAAPLLERLKSLAPGTDFESAVNQTLTGTDKTTLFLKDALLEIYAIESAAKNNQRLTVQDMKMVGPVLDPTNYTPATYNALLDQRRKVLYDNLQDRGLTPEQIKKASASRPYTPYGGETTSPAAKPSTTKSGVTVSNW
jgi:chromosome segregation ATPase